MVGFFMVNKTFQRALKLPFMAFHVRFGPLAK